MTFQLLMEGEPTGEPAATIAVYKVLDTDTGTVDATDLTEDSGAANDDGNQFRYDDDNQYYVFNLSTRGWYAPATYRVVVTLDDGSEFSVDVSLR